ncbi:MAG: hypothetical protein IJ278_02030 [Clostridia bacterium]|nr:hypothetical protein [Clostridia bacterium]
MKKVTALLVVFMMVFMCALPTIATAQYDSFEQKMIKRGYTQEDIWNINAMLYLSEENVREFILQKYQELKSWEKVREYYGVDAKKYENYIKGMKMRQETLDAIPDYIFDEMEDRGWTQSEITHFVNQTNILTINCEYAWQECKKGRTIEEVVEEKKAVNKQQSELASEFIYKNISVEEYEARLTEILAHDVVRKTDNLVADEVERMVQQRNREHQRAKEQCGITENEVAYCEAQGLTNPMDMYQAKDISAGNNVPFEEVVQTYLEVGIWSVVVIEVLNIPPEEYIQHLESIIANDPSGTDDRSQTKEMIQQIKDYYSKNGEELGQDVHKKAFDIDNYIALMVGSSKSYVYGVQKQIDEQNPDVSVFVEHDRSYVPVRFLTESYGGSVEWIEETQTVNLFFGDSRISLTIGEKELYVNGEAVISDVAPVIRNGRTFLPLRVCVNALGKQAFYSNGLILVSDLQSDLDETKDGKLIEEIIETYYK